MSARESAKREFEIIYINVIWILSFLSPLPHTNSKLLKGIILDMSVDADFRLGLRLVLKFSKNRTHLDVIKVGLLVKNCKICSTWKIYDNQTSGSWDISNDSNPNPPDVQYLSHIAIRQTRAQYHKSTSAVKNWLAEDESLNPV